ncbi:peroxisome proliferator-activated receptor gamma coactivator-related protein 1 [Podarcis raffonei]|uniref:peroxisome proliferator-activated receptor gamma coactivator-related protein 1 n=1 Tax=Podarcis raffonei TaxID=65483 RepID=UPI0023295741|nr:peroxisome proliferator-activated receptor gamma coactivator-related protein 1 [Podarcis raffonei]
MAALWGGGAGHAGAGGTLPLRGGPEPVAGNGLSSTQYLLAEDLHLTSLDAETILEAGEFLETMQDYLDSSVISIIEDFSSLTETKGRMDVENELSLLTAITDILDSTDDESLSPFDTIPDSELLTSPRERDNSSFQRFLSLSVTPPEQDFHTIEDLKEPRLCSIVTEKIEASTASLPLGLPPSCHNDSAASKKPSTKRVLFRHRDRELPVLQRSDGEEEEEEEAAATSSRQGLGAGVKETLVASAMKEAEPNPPASDGPCVIAPESISLSELVRSMHPYCIPTFTVCLSPNNRPLAEELLAGPLVLEVVPESGESMEIPVVLQRMETEIQDVTENNCTAGHVDEGAALLDPALEKLPPDDSTKAACLDGEPDLDKRAEDVSRVEDAHPGAKAQDPMDDQDHIFEPSSAAHKKAKCSALAKDQMCTKRKSNKETMGRKEATSCGPIPVCTEEQAGTKPSHPVPEKEMDKTGGEEQGRLLSDQSAHTVEKSDIEMEELEPQTPLVPCNKELRFAEHKEGDAPSEPVLLANEVAGPEAPQQLPSSTADFERQPPSNEDAGCPPKEAKPRPLSLSEYRQRRQQRQPRGGSSRSGTENQSASKWPSLPELPTELAELPCLVPPLPSKVASSGLAKDPEKPTGSSAAPVPAGSASAPPLSMPAPNSAPRVAPPLQHGCMSPVPPPPPPPPPPTTSLPAASPLPSSVCAFPPVGVQVPPTLPPPFLPPASGAFLPAVPPWPPFAPVPAAYQSLPPPLPAAEARPSVFHMVPPVPPPTWPPPPIPLPPLAPGLPYSSVEWAPQPPYWPGMPVPHPMLPIPYGDQGCLAGSLPAPSCSEGVLGPQNAALMPEPSHFRMQSLAASEKPSLPAQPPLAHVPSAIKADPRRVSDPRRQVAQGKLPSPSVIEPSGEAALTHCARKGSSPQSLGEPHSAPPSQQVREAPKPLEELSFPVVLQPSGKAPVLSDHMEKTLSIPTAASGAKEAPPASWSQEERSSFPAASVPEKLPVPTATEVGAEEAAPTATTSPASLVPQKVHETAQLSKKTTHIWKYQPLINIAQRSCKDDIVQAFINEIGIEASDLSSLLEQFEKTEAKKDAPSMANSKDNVTLGNNGSEAQQEKKMVDRLQAPELTNVAGLTPPATPPHQLWKPLAAVSLLGKAGSTKGVRLTKSLSKPHRKAAAPVHVGSGEHDYCQLGAARPKGGARWNVKQNSDITIKPIKTVAKEVPDQPPVASQLPAAVRLDPAGSLGTAAACQNPRDVGREQLRASNPVAASLSPDTSESPLLDSSPTSSQKEPLDHRTSTPRSAGSDDPCSVLLSPAASPCRDAEGPTLQQPQEVRQKRLASKRSLRCYRGRQKSASPPEGPWRGSRTRASRTRASRSFSSSSDGDSDNSDSSSSRSSSSSSSASSSRSRSRSPPAKRWRRYHSRSSSSSSCGSSWSRSRGRSRSSSCSSYISRSSSCSPSLHRRKRYNSSSSRERYQRQKNRYKDRAIEERRVVFIGKIPSRMTRSELRHRFSVFGIIEECTLHFREQGDNYGFVTYRYAEDAFAAIDGGHSLQRPDEQPFDLCFGGRRQFCKRNYADLDSNREDFEPAPARSKFDSLDFDTLLKQAQRSLQR